MAYVACGRFDGYWQEIKLLGYTAGIIILKEAGGFGFFEGLKHAVKRYFSH